MAKDKGLQIRYLKLIFNRRKLLMTMTKKSLTKLEIVELPSVEYQSKILTDSFLANKRAMMMKKMTLRM